ncbi:hypothetical protein IF1G_09004 [Cordyceps javanica]|uniref:Uncharacterized protein n=1 Tax=Cordyceps javanica TaxID=43265 RepID=A0A545USQ8_9HYPO|nr:hypothetical protein IF1G_09004 [Cordyceps javanica]
MGQTASRLARRRQRGGRHGAAKPSRPATAGTGTLVRGEYKRNEDDGQEIINRKTMSMFFSLFFKRETTRQEVLVGPCRAKRGKKEEKKTAAGLSSLCYVLLSTPAPPFATPAPPLNATGYYRETEK